MKFIKKLQWKFRDMVWLVSILIISNIMVVSMRLSDNQDITNILSIGGSLISVILGAVAIIYSFIQNNSTQDLHGSISTTIEVINQRLDNIGNQINSAKPYTKEDHIENETTEQDMVLTRVHGVISTSVQWEGKEFVEKLTYELQTSNNSKLLDYSIKPLNTPEDTQFKYSTSISLLLSCSLKSEEIDNLIDKSLSRIGVNSKRYDYYTNQGIQCK
ncbi:hypothetical protein HF638_04425 [Paenibacillus sp. SZ31]|uniref:hypothetical protein n=1 Tax=Paenibacillus sp. SZ31 TaxID=2725555 RepID=UPI00146AFFAA|nr:hypothetical protein [Paenibacillus sp. SZ31]NMI03206.1 hypothetical protein [Paenibacillus sp. SZ31]